MYVSCDESGRVMVAVEDVRCTDESYIEVEMPEGVDISVLTDYRVVDGSLMHDPKGPTLEDRAIEALRGLHDTDYVAMKLAESMASGESCEELLVKYSSVLEKRREWRKVVNEWRGEVDA